MLSNRKFYPTIPAADLDRAVKWYEEKLGLKPVTQELSGYTYELGSGSGFLLYPTPNAGQAPNTLATFSSDDVEADVAMLRERGVVFEEYDFPGLKTEDGVAAMGEDRYAAWFKDSEGNILAIGND